MSRLPDLDALELLVAVAETGSLGQAAARQGITQPSASTRIRTLERRLGVPLLVRTPTGSRLTPEGLVITDWSRSLLHQAHAMVEGAAVLKARQQPRLRISASLTIAEHLIPGWLVALRSKDQGVQVELTVANSTQVIAKVRAGESDLGFIEGRTAPADLHSKAIGRDRLVVVTVPGHPWTRRRRPVPTSELAATPLLLREPGSGTRETFDAAVGPHSDSALELGSTAAIRAAALTGTAPAVLSELAVTDELASGRLAEIKTEPDLSRVLRAVWPRGRDLPATAEHLLDGILKA